MNKERVGSTQLAIFVKPDSKDSAALSEEESMELTAGYLLDCLASKVSFSVLPLLVSFLNHVGQLNSPGVLVKYLCLLRIIVEELAQLEARVLAQAKHISALIQEALVLEAKRHLLDINVSKGLDKSRLLSVDVITRAQLSCIVVSPCVHVVL